MTRVMSISESLYRTMTEESCSIRIQPISPRSRMPETYSLPVLPRTTVLSMSKNAATAMRCSLSGSGSSR